tara:strand:- start:39 stop:350 length:312 start_codon:yes stop_codon:yes gene_type:complete
MKKYHFDCCEHNKHEYAGSIENYDRSPGSPVDVYFLDSSAGHSEKCHGYCIRFGDDGCEYLSMPDMRGVKEHKPQVWELYLKWCDKLGYEPQTYEYYLENRMI